VACERNVGALIWAVCVVLHGLVESKTGESCEGGFLRSLSEEVRRFHDLLRQKPFSLFILLGWNSISIAPLMMRSTCLGLVERMLALCT
jgi:hypothetical protein